MGHIFSRIKKRFNMNRSNHDFDYKLIMLGLDHAGKTTILYTLLEMVQNSKVHKTSEYKRLKNIVSDPISTVGFNCETLTYQKKKLSIWDIGGQAKFKSVWRFYYPEATDLVYVVDSSDRDRLLESKETFYELISDKELEKIKIIILCNKQDVPGSLTSKEIEHFFELNKNIDKSKQEWCCFGTNALSLWVPSTSTSTTTGTEGLIDCLNWVTSR